MSYTSVQRIIAAAHTVAIAALFSFQATAQDIPTSIVESALTKSPAVLEGEFAAGDSHAAYSLGLIYEYGLKGVAKNSKKANHYKKQGLATYIDRPLSIPGVNGLPSRRSLRTKAERPVLTGEAVAADSCLKAIVSETQSEAGAVACGDSATFENLSRLYRAGL